MGATTAFSHELTLGMTADTIQIRSTATLNDYGEPTFAGAKTTYDCYIMKRSREAQRTDDQEEHLIEYRVYIISPSLSVGLNDEVTLSDGLIWPILTTEKRRDEYGQQAIVLGLGRP